MGLIMKGLCSSRLRLFLMDAFFFFRMEDLNEPWKIDMSTLQVKYESFHRMKRSLVYEK